MDYDLDREEIRKACREIRMREKLYQEKLTPYVEKLRKLWGITPKEKKGAKK